MVDDFNPDDWIIVWSGRGPLLPEREQRPDATWVAPKRKYTKVNGGSEVNDKSDSVQGMNGEKEEQK